MNETEANPQPSTPPESLTLGARFIRTFRRMLVLVAVTYLGLLGMLMWFESSMVYPRPSVTDGDWQPTGFDYEDIRFASADGTSLHGWYLAHPQPKHVILFFHGNAEHVGYLGEEMNVLRQRYSASVFVFDFRGYGRSEGKPIEAGILADGVAAQQWVAERAGIPVDQVVLMGRSLGGGIAVANAASQGAKGLVLDRTFDSMVDLAANMFRWAPVRWLMRNRYPSAERIASYDGPLLQMHGTADEVIPFDAGKRLFAASPSDDKQFIEFEGLTHNEPAPGTFYAALDAFFSRVE